MKRLQNKTNVTTPDATWPYGDLNDNTGGNNGTPMNKELITDIQQTFEKIFDESGNTANGLPDNATNGFELFEAMRKVFRPYKSYTAVITQGGSSDPVATVLENTLGITLTHSFDVAGEFSIARSAGSWDIAKTTILIGGSGSSGDTSIQAGFDGTDIKYYSGIIDGAGYTGAGGLITSVTLEIRVYD